MNFEESTRDLIITAALDNFAKFGYETTSMRHIAKEVGIKTSSIYHHFKSKQDIMDAIVAESEMLLEKGRVNPKKIAQLPAQEALRAMFLEYIDPKDIDRYKKIGRLTHMEMSRFPRLLEVYMRYFSRARYTYLTVLTSLVEQKQLPEFDVTHFAEMFTRITFSYFFEVNHDISNFTYPTQKAMREFVIGLIPTFPDNT